MHPAEVEAAFLEEPGVADAIVIAVEDESRGRVLAAYVVTEPGIDTRLMAGRLAERLPAVLVPAVFTVLDRLPVTANGKVDRSMLPPPDWAAAASAYRAPRDEAERFLVSVFAQVLGIDQVGIDDNFFHLGGDSLTGSRLAARLRERATRRVPLRVIFRHPTPATLSAHLRAAGIRLRDGTA